MFVPVAASATCLRSSSLPFAGQLGRRMRREFGIDYILCEGVDIEDWICSCILWLVSNTFLSFMRSRTPCPWVNLALGRRITNSGFQSSISQARINSW